MLLLNLSKLSDKVSKSIFLGQIIHYTINMTGNATQTENITLANQVDNIGSQSLT